MQTRHKVPIVFTLYMVDVLCCALGCVILLWFLKIHEAKQRSLEATRREKAAAETGAMLDRTRATLEETQGRLYSAQQLAESLEKDRDQTRTALTQANSRIADLTTATPPSALRDVLDAAGILQMRQWVREVPLADVVKDYAVRLVMSTHPQQKQGNGSGGLAQRFVMYGSSPRGLQSLILAAKARALLAGRPNVSFEDIRALLLPSLRHRLILNLEADAEGVTAEKILTEVAGQIPEVE